MAHHRSAALLLGMLFIALLSPPAIAQWGPDGALVNGDPGNQRDPLLVSDGRGGALVLWSNYTTLHMQRIDAEGVLRWGASGISICAAYQAYPTGVCLVRDQTNGALMCWRDQRPGATGVYVQHALGDGSLLWGTDGTRIDGYVSVPKITPDGSGGAYVAWTRTVGDDVVAQRLDEDANTVWPGDYVLFGSTGHSPRILADGAGGLLTGWVNTAFADDNVFGMLLDGSGAEQWSSRWVSQSGVDVGALAELAGDGAGGAFYAWEQDDDIRGQHMAADGTQLWGASGNLISGVAGPYDSYVDPVLCPDGFDGALVVWSDSGYDIQVNRIDATGRLWGYGTVVCDLPQVQDNARIAPDGYGGAFIVWEDHRTAATTGIDIYAQHVDEDGVPQWTADGVPICTQDRDQVEPQIAATGAHGAVITWEDPRISDNHVDIWAQIVDADGNIGQPPALEVIATQPAPGALHQPTFKGLSATFSMEVDPTTLTADAMVVHGSHSGPHSGSIAYSASTATVTFIPDAGFANGEIVTVTLTDDVTSLGGTATLTPYTWTHTIAAVGIGGGLVAPVSYASGTRPIAVCAADIDGDGVLDLLAANYDDDTLRYLGGDGDGTFTSRGLLNTDTRPHGVVAFDMDGDGDTDIFSANYVGDTVTGFRNNGGGTFLAQADFAAGNGPESLCAFDYDGDGDLDLATACLAADAVTILTNAGNGNMTVHSTHPVGDNPIFITSGDLDGDGWTDLVTANLLSDDVSILLNKGGGVFSDAYEITGGDSPNAVHAADLTGDGDLDLVVSAGADNELVLRFNVGNGVFGPPTSLATSTSPYAGRPADLDGDGDLDLLCGNANADNIGVFLNDGAGNFGGESTHPAGDFPNALAIGDFNGDHALDVASANRYDDDVTVLMNHQVLSAAPPPLAAATRLGPAVPNPFNPGTRLDYVLARDGHVQLAVFDARGRRVVGLVDGYRTAGPRSVEWNGRDARGRTVAGGVYFARLVAGDERAVCKLVLVK